MKNLSKNILKIFVLTFTIIFSTQALAANLKGLSFMGDFLATHPTTVEVFLPFIEKTKEFSKGEVTFDYFAGNILYPEREAYEVLNDGRVDFGTFKPAVFEGRINFGRVVDIPYMVQNAIVGALVASEVMNFPEVATEFPKNSIPFSAWTSGSFQVHTLKPVKSLVDLKGKTIIAWTVTGFEALKALGANPIRIIPADTYLSLSKGMADGVLSPIAGVRPFKIGEVATHHLMLNLGIDPFQMSIFTPLWEDFSPEMQKFFKEEGGTNFALKVGTSLENNTKIDMEWLKANGHTFYYPTEAEEAELSQIFSAFQESWLNKLPAKDQVKGRELLEFANERAAYYQNEFEKGTYGDY